MYEARGGMKSHNVLLGFSHRKWTLEVIEVVGKEGNISIGTILPPGVPIRTKTKNFGGRVILWGMK